VVRIAISQAAFEEIARTLPLGDVAFENKTNKQGERLCTDAYPGYKRLNRRFPHQPVDQIIVRTPISSGGAIRG
jgi:hypothetical protein